ncbi:zinc-ribbon domain-containing protein [Serratia plymuthica]|uniref:zinc-ribbon domain-containing protein n=1 Tax=Serratia plymuthica TaxID=82996 RepID=UPI0020956B37|nr:zinc-ribbon domain-containing protein [Serratia plymuthica]
MRNFSCPNCGQQLSFENSLCLSCSSSLGFDLPGRKLVAIAAPDLAGNVPRNRGTCAPICILRSATGWWSKKGNCAPRAA